MGMTLVKLGGQDKNALIHVNTIVVSYKTLIGIFSYGLSFLIYTFVISRMQISLAIPVLSALNSCAMVIIGIAIFKEQLTHGQMVGIIIVSIGVLIIGVFSR